MKHKRKWAGGILLSIVLVVVVITAIDVVRISRYEVYPRRPASAIQLNESKVYYGLVNGQSIADWGQLDGALEYIAREYDCSDFRLVNLIRILYEFNDSIPATYSPKIENVLTNFRYWMDEPGGNSMCYWSENHQILFASAEYLIGQKYPDQIFPNDGLTGKQHKDKARRRILDWLKMRWDYGFTEFYSNVYYKEDIGALVNLIDYADDEEIVKKSQIILDLLLYDAASQSLGTLFVSVSGRAYEHHRKSGSMRGTAEYYWGDGEAIGPGMTYGLVATKNYQLPPVLKAIALDTNDVIIKQSNGLNLSELKAEGYYGTDTRSMMMQWGMEAFTNPEVVRNTLSYMRTNCMFSNDFIADFKTLDYRLLDWLHLELMIVKFINPQYNGVAIQRGNTYTYRTKDYSMYTVQNHQVGDYADQQHVFGMNIGDHFAIFHTHPAVEKEVEVSSPSYWVGYGHFPHSVQDENVNLSIYNLPPSKGMMEMDLLDYTHAYFPKAKFDTVVIDQNYAFGKKGETYCAIIGTSDFQYKNDAEDDLIQAGKQAFWITEASSKTQDESFEHFIRRIKGNEVAFDQEQLNLFYHSNGKKYGLRYNEDFKVSDQVINTNYSRYDSPYIQAPKKADTFTFKKDSLSLFLDFENLVREF